MTFGRYMNLSLGHTSAGYARLYVRRSLLICGLSLALRPLLHPHILE